MENFQLIKQEISSSEDSETTEIKEEKSTKKKINKTYNKLSSMPELDSNIGPNINLKITQKRYSNRKEKEYFFEKIKRKKKTELCNNYEMFHDCYYKNECSFAHGIEELRENFNEIPSKIQKCISFEKKGFCPFGIRCNYIHYIKFIFIFYLFF